MHWAIERTDAMSDAATAERALGLKQDVDSPAAEQGDQMQPRLSRQVETM